MARWTTAAIGTVLVCVIGETIATTMSTAGLSWFIQDVFRNDRCPAGLRETLERGGFSGGIYCDEPDAEAKFALVGSAETSKGKYTVYDYRYRFLPDGGNVWHGGQRLILIRNNEYIGQFVLSPPPPATIKLSSSKLTLSKPNVETVEVDLAKEIPRQLVFDGLVMDFER